ncbi:MAG: tetratricopeptide repeat protein [Terriglobales bacterium]
MSAGEKVQGLGLYPTREPLILAVLSALAVISFLAVGGLSRMYHAQQESLANRWFTRGTADLKGAHFDLAVGDFRAALRYSRDNYDYQLDLAQGLIGLKKTDEAYAYLINLWERQPENGVVNLQLARIAAQRGQTDRALRYYHNAIYATWPGDQEVERRNTRLELIEYLLGINAKPQAQSELIALAANLGDDPSLHQHVGDLFLQAQDYEHALAEYRLCLKSDRRNPAALAGAGLAAFDLGRYALAQRYLQVAAATNPEDKQSANLLKTTELVLRMDPFRRQISADERNRIVIEAFATAGDRLKSCSLAVNSSGKSSSASLDQSLADGWAKMSQQISERGLQRDPDLAEGAMDLVFEIERQTKATCGPPTGTDLALLLISKLHEGN